MIADIPGLKTVYTSADGKRQQLPDDVKQAIDACRGLDADAIAIELSDRTITAAVNGYDDAYVAAICDPGVLLPAIARCLQIQLFSLCVPETRPDVLPDATIRKSIRRWERMIATIFGAQYAAGLVAALSPDVADVEAMETMRRKLSAAIGDCIDLPAASPQ